MLDIQKYIGLPKIIVDDISETTSTYTLQFVPKGFGHTLGNAFRRIMLGYDIASSITGIKIAGVSHEYQTIQGVKESVIDIIIACKQLRFSVPFSEEKQQIVSFTIKKLGIVTSDDLILPDGIEIYNTTVPLFEITDPSLSLTVDIRIEKGYGYYSIDFLRNRDDENDIDESMILIDNDFRVIENVTYEVQEAIDDIQGGTKDMLVMTVVSRFAAYPPKHFVTFAGEVLSSYAKLFVLDDMYIDKNVFASYNSFDAIERKGTPGIDAMKSTPIDALPLSERTRNALIKNGILYVEELEKKKRGELLIMKGVGRKAIDEIVVSLEDISKSLADMR